MTPTAHRTSGSYLTLLLLITLNFVWACDSPEPSPSIGPLIELGRHLFYERRLSLNENRSCGICHEQAKGFTDGFVRAVGTSGDIHPRNTSTLLNSGYRQTLSRLDPRPQTLSEQLLVPLLGIAPVEMGAHQIIDDVLEELNADPVYIELLEQAHIDDGLTLDSLATAIEAFVKTLISRSAPYDQFLEGKRTLSAAEKRGRDLFFSESTGCSECHGGIDFDAQKDQRHGWYNTGLYNLSDGRYPTGREGLWELTQQRQDIGRYRVPTLRHLALTGPYYHDGTGASLLDVLRNYNLGGRVIVSGPYAGDGRENPYKDPRIRPLGLSDDDLMDLRAFLLSLSDRRDGLREDWSDPWPRNSDN